MGSEISETIKEIAETIIEIADTLPENISDIMSEIGTNFENTKNFFDNRISISDSEGTDSSKDVQQELEDGFRPLSEEEREKLKEGGMTDKNLDKCRVDENGKIHLDTRNSKLEGQVGEDGVEWVRKTVEVNGLEVEGVFPKFESEFTTELPESKIPSSPYVEKNECNEQLKKAIEENPELAEKFSDVQKEQIKNGETPDGYVWHHNEERGKLELVNEEKHQDNRHTGGKSIWGGGY